MSAQTEALARLSELLPDRIRLVNGDYLAAIDDRMFWSQVSQDGSWVTRACLEYALREEIEARGWRWAVESTTKLYRAFISDGPVTDESDDGGLADTPALALSLALIEALTLEAQA